jgi:hypothetical protein
VVKTEVAAVEVEDTAAGRDQQVAQVVVAVEMFLFLLKLSP